MYVQPAHGTPHSEGEPGQSRDLALFPSHKSYDRWWSRMELHKKNLVRGDPYKCENTKLPSYSVYMYFVVKDILVKLRKGGPFQM